MEVVLLTILCVTYDYVYLKILLDDLPSVVITNTQNYLLSTACRLLDLNDNEIRKWIHLIFQKLCRRIPTQCILDFLIPQLGCRNPNIRRNSLDVLTIILLTSETAKFEIRLVLEKVLLNLFDSNQTVLKAALECIVSIFTQKYVTERQILDYLSTIMPLSSDVKIRSAALLRLRNRIRLRLPPTIGSDGLLTYDSDVPDLEELSRATFEYREENPSEINSNCTSSGLRRCHSAMSFETRDSEGRASFSQIAESIMKIKFSASKRLDSLRSRISQLRNGDDSPCAMRSLKILGTLEKTRTWSKENQAIFPRKNPLRLSMNVESTVTTRMSSGYASEEVNPISSANYDTEITSELLQTENRRDIVPQMTPSLMPVSAIGKQIRPRLRKSLQTRPKRSSTVHWSNRVTHCVSMDARGAVEDLNSTQWEKQFGALQYLGGFLTSGAQPVHHELRGWSSDRVQKLCNGLVSAATCLRSQVYKHFVSRMAIERIKSAVRLLTPAQLEPAIRSLFFGLIGRVGGDTSTAFLRTAANEAIDELVDRAPPHPLILCLNDACHSPTAKSATGRRCLVRCYAAALPRLLMLNTCPAKGERPSALSRKHQDTFNKMLPHLATFLKDGDFETRNNGKKIVRMLLTIRDFEAHLKVTLNDHNLKAFTEVLDTISNRRKDPRVNGIFSTLRIPSRTSLLPRRSTNKRNNSQPPPRGRDASSTPPNSELASSISKTPLSGRPKLQEVVSSQKVIWQDRLCSLLELSAQLRRPEIYDDIPTAELVNTVSTLLQDENELVTSTALKLCLDARLLDSRRGRCKPPEDKFCPGLLSLLCEKEDTEGFTNVLALIYKQLTNTDALICTLSRKCLDETRRILGKLFNSEIDFLSHYPNSGYILPLPMLFHPILDLNSSHSYLISNHTFRVWMSDIVDLLTWEKTLFPLTLRKATGAEALVKPLLHAIQSEPTRSSTHLVHELCDITADLDADSPLIGRYLLPAAAHLHRRISVQGRDPEGEESVAVGTFTKCLINLAGEEALCSQSLIMNDFGLNIQSFLTSS
ncbi:unnamed protein product [Rodentolepis nana]|uniref:TOG domain-containing protein n=1 Tax=Rodentolepis nana TaxID=102285 RepID=A0A0R3TLY4_RODNA|nr:unnamed protein product [Rodentolepis nana]